MYFNISLEGTKITVFPQFYAYMLFNAVQYLNLNNANLS